MRVRLLALLVLSFVSACGGEAESSFPGEEAVPTRDEIVADIESASGCSPFVDEGKSSSGLDSAMYTCNQTPELGTQSKSFLLFYDSGGALETVLAEAKAKEGAPYVNALLKGEGWLYYTYSKTEQAGVLDYGAELVRPMDPSKAVD